MLLRKVKKEYKITYNGDQKKNDPSYIHMMDHIYDLQTESFHPGVNIIGKYLDASSVSMTNQGDNFF